MLGGLLPLTFGFHVRPLRASSPELQPFLAPGGVAGVHVALADGVGPDDVVGISHSTKKVVVAGAWTHGPTGLASVGHRRCACSPPAAASPHPRNEPCVVLARPALWCCMLCVRAMLPCHPGIPVPSALLPTADGWSLTHASQRQQPPALVAHSTRSRGERGGARAGWTVHVEFLVPLLGKLLSYDGDVAPM